MMGRPFVAMSVEGDSAVARPAPAPAEGKGAPAPASRPRARPTQAALQAVLRSHCPLTVGAQDALPATAFVTCANHVSHLYGPAPAFSGLQGVGRLAGFAVRDYFFARSSLAGKLGVRFRNVPVDRTHRRRGMADLRQGARGASADGCRGLVAVPAGSRAAPGNVLPFRRDPALLAAGLGLRLVPAHITGTDRILPRGRRMPRPGRVTVRCGAPLPPPGAGEPPGRWSRSAARKVEHRVVTLGGRNG